MLTDTEYKDKNAEDCYVIQHSDCKTEIQKAQERLIERNEGLVFSMVRKLTGIQSVAFDEDDMKSCANIGILRAARTYNPEKGAFSTYAWLWIKETIDREGAYMNRAIRIPEYLRGEMCRLARKYGQDMKSLAFRDSLSTDKSIESTRRNELLAAFDSQIITSLNIPLNTKDGDEETEIGDFIESDENTEVSAIGNFCDNQLAKEIEAILTDKELWVIRHRFGFEGDPQTLEWCGDHNPWGPVTRERIRQIESVAIRKLRSVSKKYHWADYRM